MNAFIIDLTHGGVKIAIELSKLTNAANSKVYENIYAYDLYNTLKKEDETLLKAYNINIIKDLNKLTEEIANSIVKSDVKDIENLIITPVHSSLDLKKIIDNAKNKNNANSNNKNKKDKINSFRIITHHEAVQLILKNWKDECEKQNVKCVEITGVKGKTSTAFILKEIIQAESKNILLLSSLGAHLFREFGTTKKYRDLILQKNISITPASILSTVELSKKIANPKCSYQKCDCKSLDELKDETIELENYKNNPYSNLNYDISIFESSLGISGLGDIGILTNIVENYPIAKGKSNAKEAKKQVFNSKIIEINQKTLDKYYTTEKEEYFDKINTFSIENKKSNVFVENINYNINKTSFKVVYNNLKTIDNNLISGDIELTTFAPGEHHIYNVLSAVSCALSLNISKESIKEGLSNFKGITGRSSRKTIKKSQIIEEINPGINTNAIENSINMISNIEDYFIIIGGKYGVTCEEIDEEKLSKFLNNYLKNNTSTNLILTDELGESIKNKLDYNAQYVENFEDAQEIAINENKNILFIYRSNYSQVSKR